MSAFQQVKTALVHVVGLPKDALHIYVGLFVYLAAAALLRRPLSSRIPVAAAVFAALAGEAWDLVDTRAAGAAPHWDRNWHDVWNTCFWPAVLFLLARYTRLLQAEPPAGQSSEAALPGPAAAAGLERPPIE